MLSVTGFWSGKPADIPDHRTINARNAEMFALGTEPKERKEDAMNDHPAQAEKLRVIACGAIAREVLAIRSQHGLDHIDLQCLPAIWHVFPDRIAPAMREKIAEARAEGFQKIFIGYAECGTQGELDKICAEEGVERIEGPHCYAFFTGNDKFLAECETEFTAFYLTDLITRQFEAFVIEPLKLDKHPELRDMVFGNYTKIVYLAQTEDEELQKKAKWAADYLKLDYEYRFTGYGDLTDALKRA
jgi:Protein of unknown function (DUF1638)